MRIAHQRGGRAQRALVIQRNDRAQLRADAVGVHGDVLQAGWGHHLCVGQRATGLGDVGRLGVTLPQQLQQADVAVARDLAAQVAQVGGLERLDGDRADVGIGVAAQRRQQFVFHRQADRLEVGRVLDLRHQADATVGTPCLLHQEGQDLVKAGDAELAVVGGAAQFWQALTRVQRLQLGQGEVFGEPALNLLPVDDLAGAAAGELGMRGHVGGAADLVLVAGHHHPVLGHHQVRFDVVGAIGNRLRIGGQGVLRQQRACAAVAIDRHLVCGRGGGFSTHGHRWCHGQRQQQRTTPRLHCDFPKRYVMSVSMRRQCDRRGKPRVR